MRVGKEGRNVTPLLDGKGCKSQSGGGWGRGGATLRPLCHSGGGWGVVLLGLYRVDI